MRRISATQRFFLCIPVAISLLCTLFTQSLFSEEAYLDDEAIKESFSRQLEAAYRAGGLTTGVNLVRQLQKADTASLPPPLASATDTVKAPVESARAATLILGHLYHCDTCKELHASPSGGVVISANGLALTNYHVLNVREAIVFGAMTLQGKFYPIDSVLAASKDNDLALVQLRDATQMPYVALSPSVSTGDELFVISHPDGYFFSLTRGFLSRKYLQLEENRSPRLQITADFAQGSSGCGIFNLQGGLIGLAASTSSIYCAEEGDELEDLQMVVKSGVPTESILKLFHP